MCFYRGLSLSILFLLIAPSLFAIYWLIHLQLCLSRKRYLVDAYGLDRKKLQKLKCAQLKELRQSIDRLSKAHDAYALEALVKPYRA